MAQFKIKQVRGLQSTIDSITGIDTITEAYTTTATDGPTGITITYSCRETDNAQVYVNGVRINQGDFGWREGTTDVSTNTELNAGTELVWNSSAIGFDLANDDEVEIIYETGIPVSTGGSVGTGTNGTSGTSGTSGVTNSNATGLTLTSPSGILYQVVVDDSGNLSTNNVGTSGTSGSSSTGPGGLTGTTVRLLNTVDEMNPSSSTDPFDSLNQTETYQNTYDWIIRNIDPVNLGGITVVSMTQGTVDSPYIWMVGNDEYVVPSVGDVIYRDEDGANYFEPGGFLCYDILNGDKNTISDYSWVTVGANGVVTASETLQYPGVVSTDLVAHLDASDSNSYPGTGTLWTDLTGNGHNGDLTGFTTTPYSTNDGGIFEWSVDGTTGEKIVFDEAITGVEFNLDTNPNQTIQAWVYVPSGFATNLFTKGTGSTGWSSTIGTNRTVSTFLYGSGAGPYGIGITGDAWNLITLQLIDSVERTNQAGTYNTGFRYYVNDTVHMNVNYPTFDYYNTNEPAGSWPSDTGSFTIGGNPVSDYNFKVGAVYVYDRILTAQEVADNYNNTKTRFGL